MLKWSVELSQFDVSFHLRTAIKGQALADFITECTGHTKDTKEDCHSHLKWELFVDGASNESGAGAGVILVSPEGHRIHSALRFKFDASNNEAEYEALLAGLRIARELKVENLGIVSDSQLVVNQILGEYQARGVRMATYLAKAQEFLHALGRYTIC